MFKTNAEWLMELPEPYRLQALNNAEKEDMLGHRVDSLGAALASFPWSATAQGYNYWRQCFDEITNIDTRE